MDQRILNMTAGQVIEYSRLVSRREELRQFPEEEGTVAELKLIEERITMDQRILNMTAGQVIEYSRLVSRREELRQFPEEEGTVAELKLIEERIKELGFE